MEDNKASVELNALKTNSSFCLNPFVQISTVPPGHTRPCCYFTDMNRDEASRPVIAGQHSFRDIWNCHSLREVRQKMIKGEKIKACQQCYNEERVGSTSMRFRSFDEWKDNKTVEKSVLESINNDGYVKNNPKYLELKPGNLCNLKCRICNQHDSNQISKELKELATKYDIEQIASQPRLFDSAFLPGAVAASEVPNWGEINQVWEEIETMLPDLEVISLAGGEPPMLVGVHRLLNRCVETGHSSHIKVFLSSNFTQISSSLLKLAGEFEMFEFIASIDGVGPIQEYIRYPSLWSDVSHNFLQVKSKMEEGRLKVLINCTIQLNNILHFTDLLRWLEKSDELAPHFFHHPYALNILFGPEYLRIDYLPPAGRIEAIKRIDEYIIDSKFLIKFPEMAERLELIKANLSEPLPRDFDDRITVFRRFTQILDEHRNQSLKESDPLLYQIIEEYYESIEDKKFDSLGLF